MWIIRICLDLYGEKFSPKKFLREVNDVVHVFDSNEPDDKNDRDPDGIFGFGSLSISSPQIYGLQYEMADYENWYFQFIDKNKKIFDQNGINKINLFIDVFDTGGQLNFEIFSRKLLKKVALHNIAIPISYYRLTKKRIVNMLSETGLSKEKIKQYVEVE